MRGLFKSLSLVAAALLCAAAGPGAADVTQSSPLVFRVSAHDDGKDTTVTLAFQNQSKSTVTDLRIDDVRLFGRHPRHVHFPLRVSTVGAGWRGKFVVVYRGTHFPINADTTVRFTGGYRQGSNETSFNLNLTLCP